MKEIPAAPASALDDAMLNDIAEWQSVSNWMAKAKVQEMELRKRIASRLFPDPKEGVNKVELPGGYIAVLDHKINRNLDVAALDSVMAQLPEDSPYRNVGVLIEYKPSLVMSGFRALPEDQALIFAQAYTEKPGAPSLEIKSPAEDPATTPASPPDWPAKKVVSMDATAQPAKHKPSTKAKAATKKAKKK